MNYIYLYFAQLVYLGAVIMLYMVFYPKASRLLASKLNKLGVDGQSQIVLIIGGSLGLSDEVLKRADYHLSFSPMTFPHQLMRVILLEQIYRSYRIISGEPYHK